MAGIEDLCGQWSHFYWKDKFMKFNNRILRRIFIQDRRAESSIVALYKKLELQNAMEILDTVPGDISAAPSLVSLQKEKKESAKPEKKYMGEDLKNIHKILSKNMYKIRQRTVAFTSKHALPNDSQPREILIRRHASIRRSLRPGSFQSTVVPKSQKYLSLPAAQNLGSKYPSARLSYADDHETMSEVAYPTRRPRFSHPKRSSSGAMMPLHRLGTLKEVPSTDVLNESKGEGGSKDCSTPQTSSSYSASHLLTPHRHFDPPIDNNDSTDDLRNENSKAEEEQGRRQPGTLWLPPNWAAEPRDNTPQNPLLRRGNPKYK
ncbi:hypothetical protein XENOCAPTIV_011796 [Xenoophorus captivus]|uniref:Sodium/hydrogen exchanger regulatory region domain-containing protein n=1 Tax=Xenoophorus captivus TaxID=1517983 RepID=A0ABV0R9K2_9TELE